jgi:hypothetical protein
MISEVHQKTNTSKKFSLNFSDLKIESTTVENYIGFIPGSSPDPFPEIIAELLAKAEEKIKPTGGYVVFDDFHTDRASRSVTVNDVEFFTNNIVTRHLEKCTSAALFACTAGNEVIRWAATYNQQGNSIHAYIIDSIGSIAVESAMDIIQQQLKTEMQGKGMGITNRYSPGYCNWDTSEQEKLFGLLPTGFCGISLNESMLMKPIKSISGIIGIGKESAYKKYTCYYCKDTHCLYRNKR